MTTATFTKLDNDYIIHITGHAGYSKGGPDIVCAACSVLICTLMQCALSEEECGTIQNVKHCDYSGDVQLRFTAIDRPRVDAIVDTIVTGFAMLEHTYPSCVKLAFRTGEKKI